LAKIWQTGAIALQRAEEPSTMGTMNISLPDALRDFVDEQVAQGVYGTSSEYVRELIRRDQERLRLRALLLEGAESPPSGRADAAYFEALRSRASKPQRRRA
jgi:antitoxin ParD1/3/4